MLSVIIVESTPSVISGREGGGETIGARTEGLEAFDKGDEVFHNFFFEHEGLARRP